MFTMKASPHACLVWRLWGVLVLWAATCYASQLGSVRYGGQRLTMTEQQLVFSKVVEEARKLRSQSTDCGVVLVTVTAEDTLEPEDDARRAFLPESIVQGWSQEVWNVFQATDDCYTYYDCVGVAVFTISPTKFFDDGEQSWEIFRVRYMQKGAAVRASLHDDVGAGASGGLWRESHMWRRTEGYNCPSDHVDALFYFNTWNALASSILQTPIPADAAGAEEHFKWEGHKLRLWPNANCKLSPVLLQAESGLCRALRCPTHTICPAGYRQKDTQKLWCVRSESVEMTSITGSAYEDSFMAANSGAYVVAPCNQSPSSTTGGECGYDLAFTSPDHLNTRCYCNSDVPDLDVACQFVASPHCTSNRDGVGGLCAQLGVCRLFTENIDWSRDDLGMVPVQSASAFDEQAPPPIHCVCNDVDNVKPPWCDRSMCATSTFDGNDVDCHTDPVAEGSFSERRGTCERSGDTFVCTCNDMYFGDHCEWNDNFEHFSHVSIGASSELYPPGEPRCFVEAADIGVSTGFNNYVECSGHGVCHVPRTPAGVYQPEEMYCVCANGYNGTRCEFSTCGDCGPFGKCVQLSPEESSLGIYETTCVCAVYDGDVNIALSMKRPGEDTCSVDLCLDSTQGRFGTLVMDASSRLTPDASPPRGRCSCSIAGNGLRNEGVFCDEPVCDRDALGNQCGISLPGLLPHVCKPCADNPTLLECAQSSRALGAVCDCDAVSALSASPAQEPYYLSEVRIDRQTRMDGIHGATGQPICSVYCQHGEWRSEGEVHKCRGCLDEGFLGSRCDEASCVNGEYEPGAWCKSGSCLPGWTGVRCDKCDPAFGTDEDAQDGCQTCLAGWLHPPEMTQTERTLLPANETCVRCESVDVCSQEGTEVQTCNHDYATVKVLCTCKAGFAGELCDRCDSDYFRTVVGGACVRMADVVACGVGLVAPPSIQFDPVFLNGILDPNNTQCNCRPHFSEASRCEDCVDGYVPLLNTTSGTVQCVDCATAISCAPHGTERITCNPRNAVSASAVPDAVCECFDVYTGSDCTSCADHATFDPVSQRCVACGLDCGLNGVPDCSLNPPVCICFNGFSGARCEICDGCGPGGMCVSGAFFTGPAWCTCREDEGWRKSIQPSTPGAAALDIISAACDICAPGMINTGGACQDAVELCGFGVHPEASHAVGGCICKDMFKPMREQISGLCKECLDGGVGPDCIHCDPPCTGNSDCTWRNDTVMLGASCECRMGYRDSLGDGVRCSQCDVPLYRGENCQPCPDDCGIGQCDVEPLTQTTYCRCPGGAQHAIPGDSSSACSLCPRGTSPVSCTPCPRCGANSTCVEREGGGATCRCFVGYERSFGHSADIDPCHSTSVLESFRADPFVLSFDAPPEPAHVETLSEQLSVLPMGTRVIVIAGFAFFPLSMCCSAVVIYRLWRSKKRSH